jgi:hypothetical protein
MNSNYTFISNIQQQFEQLYYNQLRLKIDRFKNMILIRIKKKTLDYIKYSKQIYSDFNNK